MEQTGQLHNFGADVIVEHDLACGTIWGTRWMPELQKAGGAENGRLHAKSGLIDDTLLIIGSQNYQYSAWGKGGGLGENNITTSDPDAIAEYKALFETKWEESIPVQDAEYGSTSK